MVLGLLAARGVLAQTAPPPWPVPQPQTPVLSGTGGSCGTLFAPCPAISRLGLFIWASGQYLGTGLGGDPHSLTMGGSVDISMEVANRIAVSASIPGALVRVQGQSSESIWGIGGPLEARARVRLGPVAPAFYAISPRPLWSSVLEVRGQFLVPDFDGATKYVGVVKGGVVQPAVYGAGELNLWRFQLAPGAGILVGDHQAHLDLSLRVSVQLLDRLFGDVEVLRRQALGVPAEPGRCHSAWMGAAGLRMQFRRGVFVSARYAGGQGDCVPEHSFLLGLGLAFGEGFMRIPTPAEVGFIKTWHALLMGMIDPILDCQGIMRADDGTPMFHFGTVDSRDPSIVWRNSVSYRVGEHFWEKNGYLYRDTDLSNPVLDLHGESALTFSERASMHDCPTLPGLGSPCRVAMDLPALRRKVEQGASVLQAVVVEDAQIVACLNHLSPLKAAAVFAGIQAALGPHLGKLPQVAKWPNPNGPPAPALSSPPALKSPPTAPPGQAGPSRPPGIRPKRPVKNNHPGRHKAAPPPPKSRLRHVSPTSKPAAPIAPAVELPLLPEIDLDEDESQETWQPPTGPRTPAPPRPSTEPATPIPTLPVAQAPQPQVSVPAQAEQTHTPAPSAPPPVIKVQVVPPPRSPHPAAAAATSEPDEEPERKAPAKKAKEPGPAIASEPSEPAAEPPHQAPAKRAKERVSASSEPADPAPSTPLCGNKCKGTIGLVVAGTTAVVAVGTAVVGAVGTGVAEGTVVTVGGETMALAAAGLTGGAVAGNVVANGVADHVMPPSGLAEPAQPEKPAGHADNTASESSSENPDQPAVKRGEFKGDLTQLEREAADHTAKNQGGAQGELDAVERLLKEGRNVEKLPERGVKGQTNPDLLVDGELREIKTRNDRLTQEWIKESIGKANNQIKNSGYGDSPQGSVDLQLEKQTLSDTELLEIADAKVTREFRVDQHRSLTAVRLYNSGRLLAEWSRVGGKIVRVVSKLP